VFFALRDKLRLSDPISYVWRDGYGRSTALV
jgi:hypothetical protein